MWSRLTPSVLMVAVGALVFALGATPPPAGATHAYDYPPLVERAWRVCNTGIADGRDAVAAALNYVSNNSPVNANPVNCQNVSENVRARTNNYAASWSGASECGTPAPLDNWCIFKRVWLNAVVIEAAPQVARTWRKTARHEFGHVGGLGHRSTNDSAMTQGGSPPVDATYNAHDWEALRNTY